MASQTPGYLLAEGVGRCLVDELDTALGFPLPPRYPFLVLLSNDSSIPSSMTGLVDRTGACGTGGGGDEGRSKTWGCVADDVERGFLRRVTGVGL
jgi:hypothetical protein